MLPKIRTLSLVCCALLLAVVIAMAGQWDKKTVVTFNRPIELPGMVLQPGTYVFMLADVPSSRHVIQVFNKEENHLYGMFLALPNARLKATGDTVMRFEERPRNAPEAMRAWFYPGDTWGHELVYPKAKAVEIAATSHVPVLTGAVKPAEPAAELVETPVTATTPENKEVEIAQVVQAPPQEIAQATPAPAPAPAPELPKTGSMLPLFALIAFGFMILAGTFRFTRRRVW